MANEWQSAVLGTRFEAARHIYNAVLGESLRLLDLMRESKAWQVAKALPKTTKKTVRNTAFEEVRKAFGFNRGALQKFAESCRDGCWIGLHSHLGSHDTQTTSLRAFRAVEAYAFGKRGRPRFKGCNRLNSVEGKANTVIRYKEEKGEKGEKLVLWGGLVLSLIVDERDIWLNDALENAKDRVKYVRVVRRMAGASLHWFAQLVMEGVSPRKRGTQSPPDGVVGFDIGPSTVAIVGESSASLEFFAPKTQEMDEGIRVLQRAMDRSRRATNPEAFNADGTYKKGAKIKVSSPRYRKLAARKAREGRKLAAERKREHGELANRVLRMGNTIKTEKVSYRSFQKNFGKSVGKRVPSLFVSTLKRKAESAGAKVVEFSTQKTKLSQFSHDTGSYAKKPLSQRWHTFADGGLVQRDLYSTWLARFVENDTLDASHCQNQWAAAEPLLRQAASSSPICKRGRHTPTPTHPKVRQSGSPVATGQKKDETADVVAEANGANARASESPSYPQNPLPLGMGRFRAQVKNTVACTIKVKIPDTLAHSLEALYEPALRCARRMLHNRTESSSKFYKEIPCVVAKSLIAKYQRNAKCKRIGNLVIPVCGDKGKQIKLVEGGIRVPALFGKPVLPTVWMREVAGSVRSAEFFRRGGQWFASICYNTPLCSVLETWGLLGLTAIVWAILQ